MGLLDFFVQSSAHPSDELTYKWRHGINDSRLQFLQGLEYQDSMTTEIRLLGYRYRVEETTFWPKYRPRGKFVDSAQSSLAFLGVCTGARNIISYELREIA